MKKIYQFKQFSKTSEFKYIFIHIFNIVEFKLLEKNELTEFNKDEYEKDQHNNSSEKID